MDMQDLKEIVSTLAGNQKKHEDLSRKRELELEAERFGLGNASLASTKTDYTRFSFDKDLLESEVYKRFHEIKRRTHMRRTVDTVEEASIGSTDTIRPIPENKPRAIQTGTNTAVPSTESSGHGAQDIKSSILADKSSRRPSDPTPSGTAKPSTTNNDYRIRTYSDAQKLGVDSKPEYTELVEKAAHPPPRRHRLGSSISLSSLPRGWFSSDNNTLKKSSTRLRVDTSAALSINANHGSPMNGSPHTNESSPRSPVGFLARLSAKLGFSVASRSPKKEASPEFKPVAWGVESYLKEIERGHEEVERAPDELPAPDSSEILAELEALERFELDSEEDDTPLAGPHQIEPINAHACCELEVNEIHELEAPLCPPAATYAENETLPEGNTPSKSPCLSTRTLNLDLEEREDLIPVMHEDLASAEEAVFASSEDARATLVEKSPGSGDLIEKQQNNIIEIHLADLAEEDLKEASHLLKEWHGGRAEGGVGGGATLAENPHREELSAEDKHPLTVEWKKSDRLISLLQQLPRLIIHGDLDLGFNGITTVQFAEALALKAVEAQEVEVVVKGSEVLGVVASSSEREDKIQNKIQDTAPDEDSEAEVVTEAAKEVAREMANQSDAASITGEDESLISTPTGELEAIKNSKEEEKLGIQVEVEKEHVAGPLESGLFEDWLVQVFHPSWTLAR